MKFGGDSNYLESSSSSIRTRDLPSLEQVDDTWLSWFMWKTSTFARLNTLGLGEIVRNAAYAVMHPRQNAAVDGLLVKTIMEDPSRKNLAVISDHSIDGKGDERWQKLIQMYEHKSLITIILKDLSRAMDELELKDVAEFESFSGRYMELKHRLEYMIAKGEDHSNRVEVSDFKVSDWKEKYLDKIRCKELIAIKLHCLNNSALDLSDTFFKIKSHIIDFQVGNNKDRDFLKRRCTKQKRPAREAEEEDPDPKRRKTSDDGSNFQKRLNAFYAGIKNSNADEATKGKLKELMSEASKREKAKKTKRRKPLNRGKGKKKK